VGERSRFIAEHARPGGAESPTDRHDPERIVSVGRQPTQSGGQAVGLAPSLIRPSLAGLIGALSSALVAEVVVGPALSAQGNSLDMAGIPLLLSAIMFAPLLAGMLAGLAASRHPYRAGLVGAVGLQIMAGIILGNFHYQTTIIVPPTLLSILYVPVGLWGSLIVDPRLRGRAARFRDFRDGSLSFAFIVSFLALLGAAIYWCPWQIGVPLELLLLAVCFAGIVLRNRRYGNLHPEGSVP
jgi:hypothetical protein